MGKISGLENVFFTDVPVSWSGKALHGTFKGKPQTGYYCRTIHERTCAWYSLVQEETVTSADIHRMKKHLSRTKKQGVDDTQLAQAGWGQRRRRRRYQRCWWDKVCKWEPVHNVQYWYRFTESFKYMRLPDKCVMDRDYDKGRSGRCSSEASNRVQAEMLVEENHNAMATRKHMKKGATALQSAEAQLVQAQVETTTGIDMLHMKTHLSRTKKQDVDDRQLQQTGWGRRRRRRRRRRYVRRRRRTFMSRDSRKAECSGAGTYQSQEYTTDAFKTKNCMSITIEPDLLGNKKPKELEKIAASVTVETDKVPQSTRMKPQRKDEKAGAGYTAEIAKLKKRELKQSPEIAKLKREVAFLKKKQSPEVAKLKREVAFLKKEARKESKLPQDVPQVTNLEFIEALSDNVRHV